MSPILNFLQSDHVLALLIAIFIFFITILLVAKRWIGFSLTFLLLVFSLTAGLIINYQQELQHHLTFSFSPSNQREGSPIEGFHKNMLQAMEDLRNEVVTEKENLQQVIRQVQEIFESMDIQKQKLQNFIEEAREQFKKDYPTHPSPYFSELSPVSSPSEPHIIEP